MVSRYKTQSAAITVRWRWSDAQFCSAMLVVVSKAYYHIYIDAKTFPTNRIALFFVTVQGVRDLILMPITQYRRDRRLVRGLQRGAASFSTSTAMAVIDLTNRLVQIIHGTAQFAHDVVSPPSHVRYQVINPRSVNAGNQPRDLREGMATALTVMRDGFSETVRNVTAVGMQGDDMSTVIGGILRSLPTTLIEPVIQASQATSNVLVGMRNQLTPEARKDDQEKWRTS